MSITGPNGAALTLITDGGEFHFERLARLPHDEETTASTLNLSRSPIRISHELVFTINYTTPRGENKAAVIKKEVTLASCTAFDTGLL